MLSVKVLFWYMGHNWNYGILAISAGTVVKTCLEFFSLQPDSFLGKLSDATALNYVRYLYQKLPDFRN